MPIVLVVEDGSNVAGANVYISADDAREYALQRGKELPEDNDELAAMLIQASDYIESYGCQFQGYPTFSDQALSWPRTDVVLNCQSVGSETIPNQLKGAQVQLAIAINSGVDIFPNVESSDYVVEEKIGPLTVKYTDPSKVGLGDLSPSMTAVEMMLKPLLKNANCSGITLRTRRV
jgi:hypothetical protein